MTSTAPVDAQALADIALFANLPPAVLNDVAALARTRPLLRGLRIFDQGELAGRAHAPPAGGVRSTQTGSDRAETHRALIGTRETSRVRPCLAAGLCTVLASGEGRGV